MSSREPAGLEQRSVADGDGSRTYWLAPGRRPGAPLLLVLHGMGMTGPGADRWTRLGERGVAAGFAVAFPDAWLGIWDDIGLGRTDGLDDPVFVRHVVEDVTRIGAASGETPPVVVGLSNGAFFAEHLARHGLLAVSALGLVIGTARLGSRWARPVPVGPAPLLCCVGTADPLVPYGGGMGHGAMARLARRRAASRIEGASGPGRQAVAAETVARDWAAVNGCGPEPAVEEYPVPGERLQVMRSTWSGGDGTPPVVLYRIDGGGHGWPGGPQYLPSPVIGRVARRLDATGLVLDFARAAVGVPEG